MKLRYFIWLFCLLILFQVIWIAFRLEALRDKKAEQAKVQEEQIIEQEKQAEDQALSVPEPEIAEKLAKGGKLWLDPAEAIVSGSFNLTVWAESIEVVRKVDLKLFYPSDIVKLEGDGWIVDQESGIASWSAENKASKAEGKFFITDFSLIPLTKNKGEVADIKIDFDFNKESLLDSNLLNTQGNDILESVQGARINLKI